MRRIIRGSPSARSCRSCTRRMERAVRSVVEALETRVLMSISVVVQTNLDNDGGTGTVTNMGSYLAAPTLRDAVTYANHNNNCVISFAGTVTSIVLSSSSGPSVSRTTARQGSASAANALSIRRPVCHGQMHQLPPEAAISTRQSMPPDTRPRHALHRLRTSNRWLRPPTQRASRRRGAVCPLTY